MFSRSVEDHPSHRIRTLWISSACEDPVCKGVCAQDLECAEILEELDSPVNSTVTNQSGTTEASNQIFILHDMHCMPEYVVTWISETPKKGSI